MSAATANHAVLVVRARDQIDLVRRRLQALAASHAADAVEAVSPSDTRLIFSGPELALKTWRCAKAAREQLFGGVDIRVICSEGTGNVSSPTLSTQLTQLLDNAPWNTVLALAPLQEALRPEDFIGAEEWVLRRPYGVVALAYPADEISPGGDSIFEHESSPQLLRYVLRDDGSAIDSVLDGDGFLNVEAARRRGAVPVLDVLRGSRATLIVAPPWTGKTYVAAQAQAALRRTPDCFVWLTNLESPDERPEYAPLGWKRWRASKQKAVWLIDAVDEALHRGATLQAITQHWQELDEEEAARLRVVLLARDDDTKDRIVGAFREKQGVLTVLQVFRLLPVDREEAARSLARNGNDGQARLTQALTRLREAGLGRWATHVPMLLRSAELCEQATSNLRDTLLELLCTESAARLARHDVSPRELLRIAGRIAAAMLLSRSATIDEDGLARPGVGVLLESQEDKRAFRVLTQSGPLLVRTSEGYRFRQEHAKELLAAHALSQPSLRLSLLRRLMTDADGRLRPELHELGVQIGQLRAQDAEAIAGWASAEVPPLPPDKALEGVKEIERLAPESWRHVYIRHTKRLNHPDVRRHLLSRIRSAKAAQEAKTLFLDVAWHNAWSEFVPQAIKLALDTRLPWELRSKAVYLVVDLGTARDQQRLDPVLGDESKASQEARSYLLYGALKNGADPLQVVRRIPLSGPGSDTLLTEIGQRITVEHARVVLDAANGMSEALDRPHAEWLVEEAFEVLVREGALDEDDRARIVQHLIRPEGTASRKASLLRHRLETDADVRRSFYLQFHADARSSWLFFPHPEDTEWLFERLRADQAPETVVGDLLDTAPRVSDSLMERVEQFVSAHHAQQYAAWQERRGARAAHEAERAERVAEANRRESKRLWIGDLVEQNLVAEDQPGARLHQLAWLCFERTRPLQVDGSFSSLPGELRQRVFDHIKKLLDRAEPTPLPTQPGPYATAIGLEGSAFREAVCWEDPAWLNGELIRKWLPSALFAGSRDKAEVVRRCSHRDVDTTATATSLALSTEAAVRDFSTYLLAIPDSLWEHLTLLRTAHEVIEATDTAQDYRALLLRVLAEKTWNRAATRQLLERALKSANRRLFVAGVMALLQKEPERALGYVEGWSIEELGALLRPFSRFEDGSQERLAKWSNEAVIKAMRILAPLRLREPPLEQAVMVDAEYRLRDVRDRLVERLFQMHRDSDYPAIVDELAALDPELGTYLRAAPSTFAIRDMFAPPPSPPLTLRQVADALLEARAPRFRNAHDFAETLLECIDLIGQESKQHIQLFTGHTKGKPPHESLLQSYLLLRLRDLLERREPDIPVFTPREPKEGKEVPDILASASGAQQKDLDVPIEVKWSHHKEVLSALADQLGERYVRRSHRARGIYVVGFSGYGRHTDPERLRKQLEAAAAAFKQENPESSLDFRVLDTRLAPQKRKDRSFGAAKRRPVKRRR